MILRRDDAFMAVCELLTQDNAGAYSVGTGMFISSPAGKDSFYGWIITASHIAKETNDKTLIVISTKEGKAQQLPLKLFGPNSKWKHHDEADISAFQIAFSPAIEPFVEGRFFPLDHCNLDRKVVSRDYELTAIGFPNGLGTDGMFSPFSFRSFASSGFVTLQRADTQTPSVFFCLENPSVGGYSGCPVFDLGYSTNGVMTTSKEKTVLHGIMHGTMGDQTGGKIALVTPMYYLKDIINC